jgi:hypothetical protein
MSAEGPKNTNLGPQAPSLEQLTKYNLTLSPDGNRIAGTVKAFVKTKTSPSGVIKENYIVLNRNPQKSGPDAFADTNNSIDGNKLNAAAANGLWEKYFQFAELLTPENEARKNRRRIR